MKKIFLLLAFVPVLGVLHAQTNDVLQKEVKQAIKDAYAATVRINNCNADMQVIGGNFTGVVVDAKGIILSAEHAVNPDEIFLITFPDGRQVKGKGLGSIPFADAAMILITDKGKWPVAKMGWSSLLEKGVPCISIAYPGSLEHSQPSIRFGYVVDPKDRGTQDLQTTCKMEPGDSGGPTFDLEGRVIGIHSKITNAIGENFDAPIDVFRKYWTTLQVPQKHLAFLDEDTFASGKKSAALNPVPGLNNMIAGFKTQDAAFQKTVFAVKDSVSPTLVINGTLINLKGIAPVSRITGKSFLVTKNSMIGQYPMVELPSGQFLRAKVVRRDENTDLALLEISQEISDGVNLQKRADTVTFKDYGNFLISPKPQSDGIVSVISNGFLSIPKLPDYYLGFKALARTDDHLMVAAEVYAEVAKEKTRDTTRARDGIASHDQLMSINNKPILKLKDITSELSKYDYNQTVSVQYKKSTGNIYTKELPLKRYYVPQNSVKDLFPEGRSQRIDNFQKVLLHDGNLAPADCGGPLYGTDGVFYGVNIARYSRTTSLTIPAKVVEVFVMNAIQ
ncbi:S1 family peptidase [Pinibacter soli]|uniref:Serine protease n=1 Tax=Pinibacter soli TaxID=3044211 RepID=A0ABT6RBA6_9BACT|nr:serine protease [Pinibacter soli]MDI3319798.1 serine protease [Pinibacter soli]